jgi:hypothetical protein
MTLEISSAMATVVPGDVYGAIPVPFPPRSRFETLLPRRETISPAGEDGRK